MSDAFVLWTDRPMKISEAEADELRSLVEDVREIRALFSVVRDVLPGVEREAKAQSPRGYGEGAANKTTSLSALLWAVDGLLEQTNRRDGDYLTAFTDRWHEYNRAEGRREGVLRRRAAKAGVPLVPPRFLAARGLAVSTSTAKATVANANRVVRRPKAKGRKGGAR